MLWPIVILVEDRAGGILYLKPYKIELEDTMSLKDTQTEQNLKDAFAGESQANRRYLYFAAKADVEGYNDVSAVFRSTAEGETATHTDTWNILSRLVIRRRGYR